MISITDRVTYIKVVYLLRRCFGRQLCQSCRCQSFQDCRLNFHESWVSEVVGYSEKQLCTANCKQCPNFELPSSFCFEKSRIASDWTPEFSMQQCSSSTMLESHYLRNSDLPCRLRALRVIARSSPT